MKLSLFGLLPAAALLFAACGGPGDGYKITGHVEGAGDGKAVLRVFEERRAEAKTADTVAMTGGKFTFTGKTPEILRASIEIIPADGQPAAGGFYIENAPISVMGNWNDVQEYYGGYRGLKLTARGGRNNEFNERYNALRDEVMARHPEYKRMNEQLMELQPQADRADEFYALKEEMEPLQEKFMEELFREQKAMILANPDLPVAASQLNFMLNSMKLDEMESIFNAFTEEVRNSAQAKEVREEIAIQRSMQPGNPAPDFTLMQADGTPLTLSDLRGKVVLIDFWASWCKPCRASNPMMKEIYAKYHDRGLEILGITNDSRHAEWVKALEEDQLPWLNVIDEYPVPNTTARVITMYGAPHLPTLVLIDRDGKIVSPYVEKSELEARLDELLGA